ncbi:MAG TPA: hypothetical protein VHQ89_10505, partial [Gaiellaceae bacterium]|nr:hypothetical protein [Gaiellaceae bacterium]
MGFVRQEDKGIWQQQTGSPSDPQAGNIPGGRRDVLRSATFDDATLNGFAPDSGVWEVTNGVLDVSATSQHADAASVVYTDGYLPQYFELSASVQVVKPTAGWGANAFLIFDYFSPTDFKFAGLDAATNKVVLGHRTASGWVYDATGSVQGGVSSNTWYDLKVVVSGLSVSVLANGAQLFTQQLAPRIVSGVANGFNLGLLGVGSNNSRGQWDNIAISVLPAQSTFAGTDSYDTGTADFFTSTAGTWSVSGGRYSGTASSGSPALSIFKPPAVVTPEAYVEWETLVPSAGGGSVVFDYYSPTDYKYVTLDTVAKTLTVGHRIRKQTVIDQVFSVTLDTGSDQKVTLALSGLTVTVSLNGTSVGSVSYNGTVVDGSVGLL